MTVFTEGIEHNGTRFSGVETICRDLLFNFPDNSEAMMIRAGLEFFSFTPKHGESTLKIFNRFDRQLSTADKYIGMKFSCQFKSWMRMPGLRQSSKKWSELLKDNGREMPSNREEYLKLRDDLHRERILEDTLPQSHAKSSSGGNYLAEEIANPGGAGKVATPGQRAVARAIRDVTGTESVMGNPRVGRADDEDNIRPPPAAGQALISLTRSPGAGNYADFLPRAPETTVFGNAAEAKL